ncbi:MAG: Asp-tRNA(Asn)/Glu-tRNA(Gln) amidotransferase subunit GatB, partial [Methanothrix sp.]
MFCRCLNAPFGTEPNTHVCPVCLGLPGALPIPNLEAVRLTILMGQAFGSQISRLSKWDRKHYFYPDLPKGYQISQLDKPFCVGGQVELLDATGAVESVVRFERIHLEEDAGKLLHSSKAGYSQVDLNRAGVPLIEMVSKPDITSASQAKQLLLELQLLARRLEISDADMEKGQMRCDVNVSILLTPDQEHGGDGQQEINTPVTEIKNVNSTKAVERSINAEAARQYAEWMAGGPIRTRKNKLTAGWDETKEQLNIQRSKENANDYRYMPEPDLPPVKPFEHPALNPDQLKASLPELPNALRRRLLKIGVGSREIEALLLDLPRLRYADTVLKLVEPEKAKTVFNWLLNAPASLGLEPATLIQLISLTEAGTVSFSALKPALPELITLLESGQAVEPALKQLGLVTVHDSKVVELSVSQVLAEHTSVVEEYRAGNSKLLGFLVGQVMKLSGGNANPKMVNQIIRQEAARLK